ncbi:MAG: DNA primase [Gammaproteobacteria bacterium]|nr:MAG: DNA primase [Gammaproteobacteria bacterium]
MAGRIPQMFIDDLLTRTDIVEVIDARVQLKQAGREYKACCPFHNEKTPSFTVSQVKQFYHCFGCGAHGTAITFLMEFEHMDFVEAVEELAHTAGLEVPREAGYASQTQAGTQPLYDLLEKASTFYQQQLRSHPQAGRAVDYLKQRGLSGEVAARFGVGFAPPGWDNLLTALGTDETARKRLQETGLVIERSGGSGVYDRFRDRIQFPIHDRRGRTIGFGGRVLGDDTPKYLNSPESSVFHKGQELYGLYEVRKAMRKLERLLVVEGYMDVVALAQFDINYAVATLGTATTPEHLERLFRTAPEVVFCFDGDRAGRAAAWRALENALSVLRDGREARFLFLPEGEDPDSLVRQIGKEKFEQQIGEAVHLSDFFFDQLASGLDIDSIDGRARLVDQARPLLARLPDSVFRQLMIERLGELARTDAARLEERFESPAEKEKQQPDRPAPSPRQHSERSPIREAIAILLHQPELAQRLEALPFPPSELLPGIPLLSELFELLQQQPGLTTGSVLEHWRGREEARHLSKLAQWKPLADDIDLEAELRGHLGRITRLLAERRIGQLLDEEHKHPLNSQEKQELKELLQGRQPGN